LHTIERDMLYTIETCKEYKNILLGYPIEVFIDHKNFKMKNIVADALFSHTLMK
jgi:hypothetical protein